MPEPLNEVMRTQTPEEQELQQKQAELELLESELADSELRHSTLTAELRSFENRYLRIVGIKYAELDRIEAEIYELLHASDPQNQELHDKARDARSRAAESEKETSGAISQKPSEKFKPTDELKKLYREVAKQVHPDLATEPSERKRREELMAQANQAYEEGDIERLRQILHDWKSSPESVSGDGVGAQLVRVIRKIAQVKGRLGNIEKEIEALEQSDLFKLFTKAQEAENEGRDLLSEMAVQLEGSIAEARSRLAETKIAHGAHYDE